MRILTKEESQYIDRMAPEKYGIPLGYLMENAGSDVAQVLSDHYKGAKSILFLSGNGNNGADGLVAARHLMELEIPVCIYLFCESQKGSQLFKEQLHMVKQLGIAIYTSLDDIPWHTIGAVVEGLIGTGMKGELRFQMKEVVEIVQSQCELYSISKWSIDIPAGVNANTGEVSHSSFKADYTITFGATKQGVCLYPGKEYAGHVIVKPLGIPFEKVLQNYQTYHNTWGLDIRLIETLLRPRSAIAHKGRNGHTLVIGGSNGMIGAPLMAGEASVHSGAGKTTVAVPDDCLRTLQNKVMPEVMTASFRRVSDIMDLVKDKSVLALGPGLGRREETAQIVLEFLATYDGPIVLDADALYALGDMANGETNGVLQSRSHPAIMTPHLGEFSRLTGRSILDIQKNYVQSARDFAIAQHVVLVLKGIPSLVALPNGTIYINMAGNSGMGTGGMGDVLTGMIAAFVAQGYEVNEAALIGTFLHSYSADRLGTKKLWGYTPSDVSVRVGSVISELLSPSLNL